MITVNEKTKRYIFKALIAVVVILAIFLLNNSLNEGSVIASDFNGNAFHARAKEKLFDLDIGGVNYRKDKPATRDDIVLVIKAVKYFPSVADVAEKFFAKPDTEMLVLVLLAVINSPEVVESDRRIKYLLLEELKTEIKKAKEITGKN